VAVGVIVAVRVGVDVDVAVPVADAIGVEVDVAVPVAVGCTVVSVARVVSIVAVLVFVAAMMVPVSWGTTGAAGAAATERGRDARAEVEARGTRDECECVTMMAPVAAYAGKRVKVRTIAMMDATVARV